MEASSRGAATYGPHSGSVGALERLGERNFETFRDLTQRRRQESECAELQIGTNCRTQGTCMSLNQSQFWVGASVQHTTSRVPPHKDRSIKDGPGLHLIIVTRIPDRVRLPADLPIQNARTTRLAVGEPERMQQFVE